MNKDVNNWILCASPEFEVGGKMHIDKLSIYLDKQEFDSYLTEKRIVDEKLEKCNCSTKEIPEWAILGYEQILAHEAFHVYQILTCSFFSEYSAAKRREALVALRLFEREIANGKKFTPSKLGLNSLYGTPQDKTEEEYFKIIINDRQDTNDIFIARSTLDAISLKEVVEGAAVTFQLLSQHDLRNERVQLKGKVYTKAWDSFCSRCHFDCDNDEKLRFARLMFLFLTDIYLKSKNVSSSAVGSFEEAIDLVAHLIDRFEVYQEEYKNVNQRDSEFIKSLQHIERKESNCQKILEFCGTIDEEKQFELYANIRLYADIYKRIAPIGFPSKEVTLCNKHQAVNYFLSSKFHFWGSDFSIPCVLSDYITTTSFITMWTEFSQIQFIDETRNAKISFEEENLLLQLYDELFIALQPIESNRKVLCCDEHGYRISKQAYKCANKDSLNSRFTEIFNRSLSEVIEYE